MPNANKKIKAALKNILLPYLDDQGFSGKFPGFVRRENNMLHLLSVEFDKWGGGFFLEFALLPSGDMTMPWGEVVPEAKLTAAHATLDSRARLQEAGDNGHSMRESWFRFESMDETECEDLVKRVVTLFPQANAWLREKTIGPNISLMLF